MTIPTTEASESLSADIAIIGGSGLYQVQALTNKRSVTIKTPYGRPSDDIVLGELEGVTVAFLTRHGQGHKLTPSEVSYRANIYALKTLGVRYIISVSAVGSLQANLKPLDMVVPDQMIDMTKQRISTFFGEGAVAHVSMADPLCPALSDILTRAYDKADVDEGSCIHRPPMSVSKGRSSRLAQSRSGIVRCKRTSSA